MEYTSEIVERHNWMDAVFGDRFSLLSSHKDQVVALPDGAEVFATNDLCPIAGFTMGDQVITVQGIRSSPNPTLRGC